MDEGAGPQKGGWKIKEDAVTPKASQHSLCAPRDMGHREVETEFSRNPFPAPDLPLGPSKTAMS